MNTYVAKECGFHNTQQQQQQQKTARTTKKLHL